MEMMELLSNGFDEPDRFGRIQEMVQTEQRFWDGFKKAAFNLLQRASVSVDDPEWQKEYRTLSLLA